MGDAIYKWVGLLIPIITLGFFPWLLDRNNKRHLEAQQSREAHSAQLDILITNQSQIKEEQHDFKKEVAKEFSSIKNEIYDIKSDHLDMKGRILDIYGKVISGE